MGLTIRQKIYYTIICAIVVYLAMQLTGCASLPFRITGWSDPANRVHFSNGQSAAVVGNPRITCFNKAGDRIADGLFVKVEDNFLVVDEFGKDYAYVSNKTSDYCVFGDGR